MVVPVRDGVTVLVGDGVVATTDDGDHMGATTRDGVAATTEDGDGVGKDCATGGASTDDVNASFCDNTFIT